MKGFSYNPLFPVSLPETNMQGPDYNTLPAEYIKPATKLQSVDGPDYCTDCKAFIGVAQMMLTNKTVQKQLLSELEQICSLLGSQYELVCKLAIQTAAPQIFDKLAALLDPQRLCSAILWCQTKTTSNILTRVEADNKCFDCTTFFKDSKSLLNNAKYQLDISLKLSPRLCTEVEPYSSWCKDVLNKLLPPILKVVADEENPSAICNRIEFCKTEERD